MNAYDRDLGAAGPATVHYGDGEFAILSPGRYVLCAVTGPKVPLENLRYWSPELQEAYAGPAEALQALARSRSLSGIRPGSAEIWPVLAGRPWAPASPQPPFS